MIIWWKINKKDNNINMFVICKNLLQIGLNLFQTVSGNIIINTLGNEKSKKLTDFCVTNNIVCDRITEIIEDDDYNTVVCVKKQFIKTPKLETS